MPRRQLLLQDPAAVAVQQPQSPRSGRAAAVSVPADTMSVVKSFIVSQPNRLRRGSVPKNARRAPFKGMHHRMRAEARRRHTARERAANAPEELVSFPPSPPQPPSPKVRRSPAHVPAPPAAAKKKPQEAGAASSRSVQQPRPQPIAKLASRDYHAEDSRGAWQTVRGSRNVLRKKRRAGDEYDDDAELANALRSITGTIATHVASGGDWDRTCWVGGIPSNCATEAAVRAAFAAHGQVRSVIVREKPGDAKSWALVVLGSATAAANAQAQGAQVTDDNGQAVALKVKPADVSRELTKAESSGLMRKAMHAARAAQPEGPAEAALRGAEAAEGAGGEMLTPRSRAVESARTRAPSYRSMLMLRASLLNSLGRPGKAIEDLELLAAEDQANGASLRLLGKTQRAHALARNPPSATDQPGAMVPSAHSLREAAVRRPTDVQLSQELSAAISDVQKERPFWMPSRRPALVRTNAALRVQTATDSAND